MPSPKKKSFIEVMCQIRDLTPQEVVDELSMITDMNNGIRCPVPDCVCQTIFKRWGDMRSHFLDDSNHKKDYFHAYLNKTHEPFCDLRGSGFNHGVNSLMLALIRQPTSVENILGEKNLSKKGAVRVLEPVASVSLRSKKTKPVQEQQELANLNSTGQKVFGEVLEPVAPAVIEPPRLMGPSPSDFSQIKEIVAAKKQPFSVLSEYIRQSDEINKTWRGKVLEEYVDMFHGIPPCFHCRSEEGKQIHHQNPLFHEIVLISLNKLGTTAERVIEERDKGNEEPLKSVLHDVFAYHMKPGRVCAVPYCQGCNQDAEIKRKKGRRFAE